MPRSRGKWAVLFWLTVSALCWSLVLFGSAYFISTYERIAYTGDAVHPGVIRVTLFGATGVWIAALLVVPLVLVLAAGAGLNRRRFRGSASGAAVAWLAVAALTVLTLLSAGSVGVLLLPVTLLLATAAALTPSG